MLFYIMKKALILITGLLLLFSACQEKTSPVNLFITRADDYGNEVSHSMYILFHIHAFSADDQITRLECSSFDSENGVEQVFDTLFANTKDVEYDYAHYTKYYTTSENMDVKLSFTVHTSGGDQLTQVIHYRVKGNVLLVPYENIILYSGEQSTKPNGLSLEWVSPIITQTADSTKIDIYDYRPEDASPDVLSHEWRSRTGIKFVRYNDFNFPAATVKYLQDSYLAGNKYSSLGNISTGDIILVGRGNNAIGVFQIQAIHDEEGFENDRYELTFKKK